MSAPTVTILFEGRPLACRPDQTLAAALWNHGIRVLSRSPKYGRPRGVTCARGHCTGCLVRVDGVPNVRACRTVVRDGMRVERQDSGAWYGPALQKVLSAGGDLFPVGFYYRWFTRPPAVSRLFLRSLRPLAGIGRLPDPARWSPAADVPPPEDLGEVPLLVAGSGPAGLRAAVAAAQAGTAVTLVDAVDRPGGHRRLALDAVAERRPGLLAKLPPLAAWRDGLARLAADARDAGVAFRGGCRVVGAWPSGHLLLRERAADGERLLQVHAGRLVWAAGAFDRTPLFDDADRPGVVGPRAVYRLLGRDGLDVDGAAAVVWGDGPDAWLSAALLAAAGARVTLAPDGDADPALLAAAQRLGWTLHTGCRPARAVSRGGALAALELAGAGATVRVPCDLAVVAAPGVPAYDVPQQMGAELVLDPSRGGYVPRDPDGTPGLAVTGEAAGEPPAALLQEVTA